MNLSSKDQQILQHIYDYCERVERSIHRFGADFDIFLNDQDYTDSVSMNILQIGELVKRFSDEFVQETKDEMDWRAIRNMRNMFAHDYGSMDLDRIWETATEDIPVLKEFCSEWIQPEEEEDSSQGFTPTM